jgi:hypothetical protein
MIPEGWPLQITPALLKIIEHHAPPREIVKVRRFQRPRQPSPWTRTCSMPRGVHRKRLFE